MAVEIPKNIFFYDELTWPEVTELKRDTPLILPLGSGYDLSRLGSLFDKTNRIGILPSFPFGWSGSGLTVPQSILGQYLSNLLEGLREDGFKRVYILAPSGLDVGAQAEYIHADVITSVVLPDNGNVTHMVILIPIGHTEQHGYHLPLSVDTIIIDAIAKGTVERTPGRASALPVMPYGVSTHRSAFAGTLNAGGRAFEDFWLAVIEQLIARGCDRFYFMSGHGGNMSFLVNIVKYAGERHPGIFCATAFLHTSGVIGSASIEKHRTSKTGGMGHACELETSFMLHLRPDLCRMNRVVDETDFIATPSYYMDWIEGGALIANPPWYDDTQTGAYGAGSFATAEKGRLWLEAAIVEKAGHVEEIHEQQERREKRRRSGFGLWGKKQSMHERR